MGVAERETDNRPASESTAGVVCVWGGEGERETDNRRASESTASVVGDTCGATLQLVEPLLEAHDIGLEDVLAALLERHLQVVVAYYLSPSVLRVGCSMLQCVGVCCSVWHVVVAYDEGCNMSLILSVAFAYLHPRRETPQETGKTGRGRGREGEREREREGGRKAGSESKRGGEKGEW